MKNMQQIIKSHNRNITKKENQAQEARKCNCRVKSSCPLGGNCLTNDVIYRADVNSNKGTASYIGLASGNFKTRYNNHTKSFRHKRYEKETELSKYIWGLKNKNIDHQISWSIVRVSNTHKRDSGQCNLCIEEKLQIIRFRADTSLSLLNKRTELVSKCRHGGDSKQKSICRVKMK